MRRHTFAHDAHCNTIHDADENPCPPARDVDDVVKLASGTEIPRHHDEDLRQLIVKINGFLYLGLTMNAILDTVRVLRANPEFARRLLDLP
jgi:hypothetical protein